jgi:hypothetical protein
MGRKTLIFLILSFFLSRTYLFAAITPEQEMRARELQEKEKCTNIIVK